MIIVVTPLIVPLPQITIIRLGLEHFGASPAWVQRILDEPFKAGRKPCDYLCCSAPSQEQELPSLTHAELEALRDKKPTTFAIGHKVSGQIILVTSRSERLGNSHQPHVEPEERGSDAGQTWNRESRGLTYATCGTCRVVE